MCLAPPVRTPALTSIRVLSQSSRLWSPQLGCLRSPYFYRTLCQPRRQLQLLRRPQPWLPAESSRGVYQKATRRETPALTEVYNRVKRERKNSWVHYHIKPVFVLQPLSYSSQQHNNNTYLDHYLSAVPRSESIFSSPCIMLSNCSPWWLRTTPVSSSLLWAPATRLISSLPLEG